MKIAIDCRMFGNSGIGTYIREALPYILESNHEYLLIGDIDKLKSFRNEKVEILECNVSPFSLNELYNFPLNEINSCDVFYTPNYNIPFGIKISIYSTIHDVVFLDIKNIVGFFGKLIRRFFICRALKISKKVFTVSNFSKKRIEKHFPSSDKILVTYNGISKEIFNYKVLQETEKIKEDKYFIYVGNVKKHKGLSILLKAYEIARNKGLESKLLIVGSYSNFKTSDKEIIKNIKKLEIAKEIIFTGYIDNTKLIELVAKSVTLIQPSIYEGFGLPPLEALALGKIPIISDIEVFREIYDDFPVIYFDIKEPKDLAEKMLIYSNNVLNDVKLKKRIIEKYSYENVGERIKYELGKG